MKKNSKAPGFTGGASIPQIGEAAVLRNQVSYPLKKDLNQIVHSADPNPHKKGTNPYADKETKDDPKAEAALEKARKQSKI
jgi:hypothetical protein